VPVFCAVCARVVPKVEHFTIDLHRFLVAFYPKVALSLLLAP